ncbi:glycosyltransferase [Gaopeijia maritima]|uniref:Glycosyltransferase n=1 Tax=Gaopeijia maritima TaxID=3119007 RepID=A0ABU9EAT3_9BACT
MPSAVTPILLVVGALLVAFGVLLPLYTFLGYPALLSLRSGGRRRRTPPPDPQEWPRVTVAVPAYNEAAQIRDTIEGLLALDYPADRIERVIVSDASSDGTDEIVLEYADRGIELKRVEARGGKTVAENVVAPSLNGEIIVNTDASIRLEPDAVKALVRYFADPTVGVASGRDVSIENRHDEANAGETRYVNYEMWLRDLETRAGGGIVGASGSLYAIRAELHRHPVPGHLSRDFASALTARDHGYRAVTVNEAVCYVPRTHSLSREYRRKVRTITRGMETLGWKKHLLNPFRHGVFAWMLFSHKVCRWLIPVAAVALWLGAVLVAAGLGWTPAVIALVVGLVAGLGLAWVGQARPDDRPLPGVLSLGAFAALSNIAILRAWFRAWRGAGQAVWEPTRRKTA